MLFKADCLARWRAIAASEPFNAEMRRTELHGRLRSSETARPAFSFWKNLGEDGMLRRPPTAYRDTHLEFRRASRAVPEVNDINRARRFVAAVEN